MANGLFAGGTGTSANPYLIEDAFDLNAVRNKPSSNYKLIKDIDLNIEPFNQGTGWVPINNYTGTFNGNGFKIKNLYINERTNNNIGLFGITSNPVTISDLTIINGYINCPDATNVGGIVGSSSSAYDNRNINITRCRVIDTFIRGKTNVGGICGYSSYTGSWASTSMSNCYTKCDIGGNYSGGLFGYLNYHGNYVSASIKNCISMSKLDKSFSNVGGLCGYGGYNSSYFKISNSFWDKEISGITSSSGGGSGITILQSKTANTFSSWTDTINGKSVWRIINGKRPRLWYETDLCLIKDNNIYFNYKNNEFIETDPSVEVFKRDSVILSDLIELDNRFIIPMKLIKTFSSGSALYSKNIQLNKLIINEINVYNNIDNIELHYLLFIDNIVYTYNNSLISIGSIDDLTESVIINNSIKNINDININEFFRFKNITLLLFIENNLFIPKLEFNTENTKAIYVLDNPSIVTYTEYDNIPIMSQTMSAISKIRFLVSNDNIDYKVYKNNEWSVVDKSDIMYYGMDKSELESITQESWADLFNNEAYKNEFKLLIGIYGENPNQVLINDITVEFAENKSPYIINPQISPDNIHNEYATITGTLRDYEGDNIQYRVLIRKNNEDEFYVADNWVTVDNGFKFTRAYNKPYFNTGENIIRVEVKDQRDAISYWDTNLVLTNNNPLINYSYNPFGFIGTISDEDTDKVSIQISLNGDIVVPFGEPMDTPKLFKYEWDSNLVKKNVINTIKIELLDEYGGYSSEEFTFIGEYKNILFMDEDGYYYSTDTGIPIKVLDKGIIESGEDSEPIKIIVKNNTNYTISNLKLELIPENIIPNNIKIYMSETNNPLTNKDTIEFISPMSHGDEKDIYLYIKTDEGSSIEETKVNILANAKLIKG